MIGLDTNIVIRFLVGDDALQSAKARRLIENNFTEENPGFISVATILETAWVLESAYKMSSQQIAAAIRRILLIESFVVQNEQEVYTAMMYLRAGLASFDDALIAALGQSAGCDHTYTFDRKAARLPGFKLL